MKLIQGFTGLILLIIILATSYYLFFRPPAAPQREPDREEQEEAVREPRPEQPVPVIPPQRREGKAGEKVIAIIIDDIGFSPASVQQLLTIGAPLGFAVLPFSPHARDAAEVIHAQGREILLHLPMEPLDGSQKPGPGALFRNMTATEIRKQLADDLGTVPYAAGVNNHMGSAFMEDEEKLLVVLEEVQRKKLFFIDSRTTAASRAEDGARKTKVRFAARRLFLDNNQEQGVIFRNLLDFVEKKNNGSAVIIGHPYPGTIAALREAVPLLQARGIQVVPPSELVGVLGEK